MAINPKQIVDPKFTIYPLIYPLSDDCQDISYTAFLIVKSAKCDCAGIAKKNP